MNQNQNYDSFSNKAFAIKIAFGYLTGTLAADCGYYFAYTTKEMKKHKFIYFTEMRDSIYSQYTPVNSNPFSYLSSQRKTAENYYNKKILKNVTLGQFSSLSQKLHDSPAFTSVMLLILEASIASLIFMPGGYAIALETLSDVILGKEKLKLAPIQDPQKAKLIRKECKQIIEKYAHDIKSEDKEVLLGKIDQMNQVTNKSRLKAPFEKLDIELLQDDLFTLNSRNDFLHGRIPDITDAGEERSLNRKSQDLYYSSIRFYTLLNMLILKWIGYDNYIINYPKLNERFCGVKLEEPPYRKV